MRNAIPLRHSAHSTSRCFPLRSASKSFATTIALARPAQNRRANDEFTKLSANLSSAARRAERLWSTVAINCRRLCCARSVSVCAFSAVLDHCRLCRVDGGAVYEKSAVRATTLSRASDSRNALSLFLESDACADNAEIAEPQGRRRTGNGAQMFGSETSTLTLDRQ